MCWGGGHGGTKRAFTPPLPFFTLPPIIQARLDELCSAADRNDMLVHVFQFAPLRPGESLQAHVRRQCQPGQQPSLGPTLQVRLWGWGGVLQQPGIIGQSACPEGPVL